MAEPSKIASVSHLGGIQVGYRLAPAVPDPAKPTLVMFNPFTASTEYYVPEFFENKSFSDSLNLLAVEPLGHGRTRLQKTENFTFWDTAIMTFQLLDILGIDKVFTLGTSQGGWMAAQMALVAPERVKGIIPVGSTMDAESAKSRELGCWDGPAATSGFVTMAGDFTPQPPDFEPGDAFYDFMMEIGFGKFTTKEIRDSWAKRTRETYRGDDGKRRVCMAAVALAGRDSLHGRLPYIKCPVLWLQGTDDIVFSVAQAQSDIKLFKNSVSTKLVTVQEGVHFLGKSHPEKVRQEVLDFIFRWNGSGKL